MNAFLNSCDFSSLGFQLVAMFQQHKLSLSNQEGEGSKKKAVVNSIHVLLKKKNGIYFNWLHLGQMYANFPGVEFLESI